MSFAKTIARHVRRRIGLVAPGRAPVQSKGRFWWLGDLARFASRGSAVTPAELLSLRATGVRKEAHCRMNRYFGLPAATKGWRSSAAATHNLVRATARRSHGQTPETAHRGRR